MLPQPRAQKKPKTAGTLPQNPTGVSPAISTAANALPGVARSIRRTCLRLTHRQASGSASPKPATSANTG